MSKQSEINALADGRHNNPFAFLGPHPTADGRVVRTFQPGATAVDLVEGDGRKLASMRRVHDSGLFEAPMPARKRRYALRVTWQSGETQLVEDPYRFPSTLGEMDLYLLGEGSDQYVYRKLGAHLRTVQGISGTRFAVWAPNASRVSVVGDF
ncbi:MAG: 1,4-alpha-glucan branching enzyme, partial [Gammaproteobacteria bacterium]|nr:1,4-alpha-glucan branching enzyme [Gammaproteobacteria bacterium]